MDTSTPENLLNDEYSESSTIIKFNRPIPLMRGPLRSDDDGSFVLAFRNHHSWLAAFKACESKLIDQCEGGARIGCAISASDKCKPPWWCYLIGGIKLADLKEREICEERETEGCFVAAKEKCVGFAKDKCSVPFNKARIAPDKTGANRAK